MSWSEVPADDPVVSPAHVSIVEDDVAVGGALRRLLSLEHPHVHLFDSAEAFLARQDPTVHGCILLDMAMPGIDGLQLQRALRERGNHLPVIFVTGRADVSQSVQAMKHGAFDFLSKPVDEHELFGTVERALLHDLALRRVRAQRDATDQRLSSLTGREREVITHVMAGRLNKQIAADLGTSEKTVKVHRARGMEKMDARSVAELVRMVERAHPAGLDSA